MARRRAATEEPPPETTPEANSPSEEPPISDTNGAIENGERKPQPVFKVGPVATDKDHAVTVAVWANQITMQDGRSFTVHNLTIDSRYYDAKHVNENGSLGGWKSAKGFRGSQIGVLTWCLRQAEDYILRQRDPSYCPI